MAPTPAAGAGGAARAGRRPLWVEPKKELKTEQHFAETLPRGHRDAGGQAPLELRPHGDQPADTRVHFPALPSQWK